MGNISKSPAFQKFATSEEKLQYSISTGSLQEVLHIDSNGIITTAARIDRESLGRKCDTFTFNRLQAASLFLQFFLFSASLERQSCETRCEKRGWQPEKKKRDCPHSQSQWNTCWPHNAKIRLADAWSVDNELSTIETIDELMMAEALQKCVSRFPNWRSKSMAYGTLRNGTLQNETKWNLYFVKWNSVLCKMKLCTLRNCEICTLRNENLYFAK